MPVRQSLALGKWKKQTSNEISINETVQPLITNHETANEDSQNLKTSNMDPMNKELTNIKWRKEVARGMQQGKWAQCICLNTFIIYIDHELAELYKKQFRGFLPLAAAAPLSRHHPAFSLALSTDC